jgi:C-terminal processing protease CtpA/Prc
MRAICRLLVASLLATLLPAALGAQDDSVRISRLSALGRLFGVAKYFHPAFLERDIPWDSATVAAIDAVSAARTTDDYRAAITSLLGVFRDPVTRVATAEMPGARSPAGMRPSQHWETAGGDSTLVLSIPDFTDYTSALRLLNGARADVARAASLVFDLRGAEPEELGDAAFVFGRSIQAILPSGPVATPAHLRRMHSGFAPQLGSTSGGYWSGSYEIGGTAIVPAPGNRARRIVFLVTPGSDIPDVAFALRNAGQAAIVAEGSSPALRSAAESHRVPMDEGVTAIVRLGEVVGPSDADTVIAPGGAGDPALRAAIAFARRPPTSPVPPRAATAHAPAPENAYAEMRTPSAAYRILAAYRYWNAIHYFYPYKGLIGEDWNAALPRAIRLLEGARDSTALGLALSRMATWINDSHSRVTRNFALINYVGRLTPAVLLQYVGGEPVVVRIGDDSLTKKSGLAVGDVVLRVDGEAAAARRARLVPLVAHSTPQALDDNIAEGMMTGNDSSVRVTVRGADNRERTVTLPRRAEFRELMQYPRAGPVMKLLPGNIGYADLSLLTPAMVDSMFTQFKDTRGIIFDDRGYPQGTAWSIAPRLSSAPKPAAAFRRPLVMSPDSTEWSTHAFMQMTPAGDGRVYRGKTILLVDERTISQAEHTGLFLEAANHTTIVGSPTMGANGDVTNVALVGGMYATFTGHDVRHADGRQLQRKGLQPDVVVRPTLAGIRAGRDEVLERAVTLVPR